MSTNKVPDTKAFEVVDKDKNGFIEMSELTKYLLAFTNHVYDSKISLDTVKFAMKDWTGHDGRMNFEEYQKFVVHEAKKCFE